MVLGSVAGLGAESGISGSSALGRDQGLGFSRLVDLLSRAVSPQSLQKRRP